MSTEAYLKKLDLAQLKHARDRAIELITEKESEQKLVVWCLEDRHSRLAFFAEADYLKAAEALLAEAQLNAASPQNPSPLARELHLVSFLVPASEYAEFGLPWPDVRTSPQVES